MNINNVDVDKITISNKVFFGKLGFKYFIGYKDDKKVIYNGHVKSLDETNCMCFVLIKNDALLKKYHKILDKVSSSIKKGFDSQQVHYEE